MFRLTVLSWVLFGTLTFFSCREPAHPELQQEDPVQPATPARHAGRVEGDPSLKLMHDTISLFGPHSITRNILEDRHGNLWLATWAGIIRYDGEYFTNVTLKSGLTHFNIMSVLEDKMGNLWFGSIGGGVYRLNLEESYQQVHSRPYPIEGDYSQFTSADGLPDNAVLCMLEDKSGNIWFGTKGGACCYNSSALLGKGHRLFTCYSTNDGLCDNFVSTMTEDQAGKIWFGTNGGISCLAPPFSHMSNPPNATSEKAVFTNFNITKDTSFHLVRSIIEDKNGMIWIGSAEGLFCYDPVLAAKYKPQGKERNALSKLTSNGVYYIFEDSRGTLWLSGGEATSREMILYRYDNRQANTALTEKSLTKITTDKQVFGITEDRNGNIWYGTANGVCRITGVQSGTFAITRLTESGK